MCFIFFCEWKFSFPLSQIAIAAGAGVVASSSILSLNCASIILFTSFFFIFVCLFVVLWSASADNQSLSLLSFSLACLVCAVGTAKAGEQQKTLPWPRKATRAKPMYHSSQLATFFDWFILQVSLALHPARWMLFFNPLNSADMQLHANVVAFDAVYTLNAVGYSACQTQISTLKLDSLPLSLSLLLPLLFSLSIYLSLSNSLSSFLSISFSHSSRSLKARSFCILLLHWKQNERDGQFR